MPVNAAARAPLSRGSRAARDRPAVSLAQYAGPLQRCPSPQIAAVFPRNDGV